MQFTMPSTNPYLYLFEQSNTDIQDNGEFKLDADFMEQYTNKQPKWGFIGYITYKRTYARYIKEKDRTEEYFETIQRVVEGCMNILKTFAIENKIGWNEIVAQDLAQQMYKKMWQFKFLPSGRGLWMMGTKFVEKHGSMALNSCAFVSTEDMNTDPIKPFKFMMDNSMLGVGVGFDTLGKNKITIKKPIGSIVFKIPDSREGWVDALVLLLNAYFYGKELPIFDYSQIRPAGERLYSFGGISAGHEPLEEMLNKIKTLLESRIDKKIRSVDIVDIMTLTAKCIVSGNIRRSALIGLGDSDDDEYIRCKQDKDALLDHRWASNNSVYGHSGMDYTKIIEGMSKNGEPAVIWLDNARKYSRMGDTPDFKDIKVRGTNPCCEQSLESTELCNLVETFPSHHSSYEEFQDTLFFAYLYGKIVTIPKTHWEETNEIMQRNRRMGISQSGITEAFALHGRETMLKWSNDGYLFLRYLDNIISDKLGINRSIKITSVKPSGTISILSNVPAGIHYQHSKYYIRRIRIAENSELIPYLKDAGYYMENDKSTPNTIVVEFPVKEKYFYKSKDETTIEEQVQNAIDYQRVWSDNQVSITVDMKKGEETKLPHILRYCEDKLKGISIFPEVNGFEQLPYEKISEEKYNVMMLGIKPITFLNVKEEGEGENFCSGGFFCKTT